MKLKIRDTEDFKKSEYLKSLEGRAETKAQLEARGRGGVVLGALAIKVKRVERIATSLEEARAARWKVGKALGLSGPARSVAIAFIMKRADINPQPGRDVQVPHTTVAVTMSIDQPYYR